jgi:hypothetical protein
MKIDGHSHACGEFLTPEGIIRTLDKSGVDKVILVPGELESKKKYSLPNLAELFPDKNVVKIFNHLTKLVIRFTGAINQIPKGNEYVHDLVNKTNGRVIQFIWITTFIENPIDYLNDKLDKWKFKGIKLHQCWENFSIDSNFFKDIANWAEKNDIPLFIHLFSDSQVRQIIEYKRQHSKLILIIAHLFGLELFIKSNLRDENLFFDTSTFQVTSTKRLIKALEFHGTGKITMGSDSPYGKDNLKNNVERINKLELSGKEKDMILGENMTKLLKLK